MIADDIRLGPDGTVKLASQPDPDAPRVTPLNARWWRQWAGTAEVNGQVVIGTEMFLDMLRQIETPQP